MMNREQLRLLVEGMKWNVFPLSTSKVPCAGFELKQYLYDVKISMDDIDRWNKEYHPELWAIITGKISGITAIDHDTMEGFEDYKGLKQLTTRGWHEIRKYNTTWKQNQTGISHIRNDGGYIKYYGLIDGPLLELEDKPIEQYQKKDYIGIINGNTENRHIDLLSLTGHLINAKLPPEEVYALVHSVNNNNKVKGPQDEKDVNKIIDFVLSKQPIVPVVIPKYNMTTDSDLLCSSIPEPEWQIEGILLKGGITLLSGPSGGSKSFIAAFLAYSLARGGEILGRPPVQPVNVLRIDVEQPDFMIKKRTSWFVKGMGLKNDELQRSHIIYGDITAEAEDMKAIEKKIDEVKAGLLIIDTARILFSDDENDTPLVNAFYRKIKTLIAKHHCSVLLIHHNRKADRMGRSVDGEEFNGCLAWRSNTDLCLQVSTNQDEITLNCTKNRMGMCEKETIKIDSDGLTRYNLLAGVRGRRTAVNEEVVMQEILELCERFKEFNSIQDLTSLVDKEHNLVYRCIKTLQKDGILVQGLGRWGIKYRPQSINEEVRKMSEITIEDAI